MYFQTNNEAERINETTKQKAETNLKKKIRKQSFYFSFSAFTFWVLFYGRGIIFLLGSNLLSPVVYSNKALSFYFISLSLGFPLFNVGEAETKPYQKT